MSQKPKTGAQSKPGLATKAVPNKAPSNGTPGKTVAAVKAEPVTKPVVKAEPSAKPVPVVKPEVRSEPAATPATAPTTSPEPVVALPVAVAKVVEAAAKEAITTTTNAATTQAASITKSVAAAVEPVTSLTARTVRTATALAIKPTQTTLTQGMKTMLKSTEDFVAFGQANLEAFVKSGQIWSAGVQELTKQIASSAKASFDESVTTFKAISTAKSVKEAMDLQSTFAKATLEKAMAESNKLTDASIKLTEQTLAPITARVTVAVETFGKTA
jgi:phasin family protein